MGFKRIEEIIAWKESRKLVNMVYSITRNGQIVRDFGFKDQLQRAEVSIMANIAEGFGSSSNAEFSRFLSYSRRSAYEVVSLLYVGLDNGYFDTETFEILSDQSNKVLALVSGLRSKLMSNSRK